MFVVVTTIWRILDARKSAFLALFVPVIDLRICKHSFNREGVDKKGRRHTENESKRKVNRMEANEGRESRQNRLKI